MMSLEEERERRSSDGGEVRSRKRVWIISVRDEWRKRLNVKFLNGEKQNLSSGVKIPLSYCVSMMGLSIISAKDTISGKSDAISCARMFLS